MKLDNKFLFAAVILLISAALSGCASKKSIAADTPAYTPEDTRIAIISDALARYTDWTTARISGKLHLESLPVTPSVKIYMKKGKELSVSASAIFVGEVFRLDMTQDSLLIVNKLKKVYCRESVDRLNEIYPGACGEIQSILLGRMIVPGSGELSVANIGKTEIEMVNNMRKVKPSIGDLPVPITFYYLLDREGRISDLVIEERGKKLMSLSYNWQGNGDVEISTDVKRKNKTTEIQLDLDRPKWGGEPLAKVNIGKGYRRVGLNEFFKSI